MGLILRSPDIVETVRENAIAAQRVEVQMTARARAPLDKWHNIGDPGEPAFQNLWFNNGGTFNPAGFFKDTSGFVRFRGMVQPGAAQPLPYDNVIFTLPTGYRPPATEYQSTLEEYGGTSRYLSAIGFLVGTNGNVVLRNPVGTVNFVSIDGRAFRAA